MDTGTIIKFAVSAVAFVVFLILRIASSKKEITDKKSKRKRTMLTFGVIVSAWYFVACVVNAITGGSDGISVDIEMFAPRSSLQIGSYAVPDTTITAYCALAVIAVLCLIFRLFIFPRFSEDEPKGIQNVIELAVEACDNFVTSKVGPALCNDVSPYIFSVFLFMLGAAFSELFGRRSPTSDLVITFSLALMTLFSINFYGIKVKKIKGRIKSLASPSPIIFPMKVLSDLATPVSLACRLFGNMLGGMIVLDLLRNSLGGYSVGVSALAGLYFNLFHPAIQAYVFCVLTLTFINEATE